MKFQNLFLIALYLFNTIKSGRTEFTGTVSGTTLSVEVKRFTTYEHTEKGGEIETDSNSTDYVLSAGEYDNLVNGGIFTFKVNEKDCSFAPGASGTCIFSNRFSQCLGYDKSTGIYTYRSRLILI